MYLIRRKCHVIFDLTETRYVQAKFSLAGHLDRLPCGRYFQPWSLRYSFKEFCRVQRKLFRIPGLEWIKQWIGQ